MRNRTARSVSDRDPGQSTESAPLARIDAARSTDETIPVSVPPVPSHSMVAAHLNGSRPCIAAVQATCTAESRARAVSPTQLSAAARTRSVLMLWRNESASSARARADSACRTAEGPSPRTIANSAATHAALNAGRHEQRATGNSRCSALRSSRVCANRNRPLPSASAASPVNASLRA